MAVTSQQQALGSRPSKKERSKSRESKERARKHTSEVDSDKEMVEPGGRNSQTVALSAELSKIKKELEVAKRVRLLLNLVITVDIQSTIASAREQENHQQAE